MKSLEISIPTACHEPWQAMTPAEKGRFCLSCQKEVIDFTSWNEDQLKQFFQNQQGNVCGRFRPHQLKKYQVAPNARPFPARIVLLSLLGLASAQGVSGQHVPATPVIMGKTDIQLPIAPIPNPPQIPTNSLEYVIRGQVWAENEQDGVLPGVSILVKGTTLGTATDAKGNFELDIPSPKQQSVELVFSFIGYTTEEKTIDLKEKTRIELGKIQLKEEITSGLTQVCVVGSVAVPIRNPIKRLWWKIKRIF